jgi:hypothetical protein
MAVYTKKQVEQMFPDAVDVEQYPLDTKQYGFRFMKARELAKSIGVESLVYDWTANGDNVECTLYDVMDYINHTKHVMYEANTDIPKHKELWDRHVLPLMKRISNFKEKISDLDMKFKDAKSQVVKAVDEINIIADLVEGEEDEAYLAVLQSNIVDWRDKKVNAQADLHMWCSWRAEQRAYQALVIKEVERFRQHELKLFCFVADLNADPTIAKYRQNAYTWYTREKAEQPWLIRYADSSRNIDFP